MQLNETCALAEPAVRDATPADVPMIAALGERFYHEAGWGDVASWDAESISRTLDHLVSNDDGIVVVLERHGAIRGMAGGMVYPLYFNFAHRTGQELFWWVDPEERIGSGRLLMDELERQALSKGAESWAMIALEKVRPEATGLLYRRRGYRPSEHSYIKRLAA